MSNAANAPSGRGSAIFVSPFAGDAAPSAFRAGADVRHQVGQTIFSAVAPDLVRRGWSVFPQNRGDRRGPGLVDGRALQWKEYATRIPTEKEIEWWGTFCPRHNVACIMGPASGDVFGVDIDVSDEALSNAIQDLAGSVLGLSPFRRVGRHPRIVLLYRQAPEAEQAPGDRIPSRSFKFVEQDASGSVLKGDDGIEILSRGKPVTFYGLHHKTGEFFKWLGKHPIRTGPEAAPLVTQDQVVEFLEAVQKLRRFHRNTAAAGGGDVSWVYDEAAGLHVPKLSAIDGSPWVENEQGIVVDGREAYLFRLVGRTVWSNEGAARDESGRGFDQLCAIVFEQFKVRAEMSGKWDESFLRAQVREKVYRAVREARDNDRFMRGSTPPSEQGPKAVAPERVVPAEGPDDLAYLPNGGASIAGAFNPMRQRRKLNAAFTDATEEKRAARALQPDRTEIAQAVGRNIDDALDAYFGEVYAPGERTNNIHLLKAPTGAGKTSKTIAYIAADPRTKMYDDDMPAPGEGDGEVPEGRGPLLMLLPTYSNIEELRLRAEVLNLDKGLSDADLAAQARERNLFSEAEIEVRLSDMRREAMAAGLRTMIYRGKANAGCMMKDKLDLLTQAGIGSAGLCKATVVNDDDEREEKFCPHYHECPAITQRKEIARSHVVFMPHAFLTLSHPEEMASPRGVIADERVFHLFLHTTTFHLATLKRERREPRLTKKEREQGADGQDFLAERNTVADLAYSALQAKVCPAQRISDYRVKLPDGGVLLGRDLVQSAKRVCSHAISSSQVINPDMSIDDVRALCEAPTGTEVREELRFWKIVEERIAALEEKHGSMALPLRDRLKPETAERFRLQAKGDKDYRIQFLIEDTKEGHRTEKVRISWRSSPNWQSSPLLLLDASASTEITQRIFNGRHVVVHEVPAPLNVRTVAVIDSTYSNAAIVQRGPAQALERLSAAKTKDKLRKVISAVSALYGWGRVVVGSNIIVRRAINTQWASPANVDYCHYGAMRGLDFAKNHTAALSFGRMEVPVRSIDGIVAALTYDDDEPEKPFDVNGDGLDPETGEDLRVPMVDTILPMRSGRDVTVQMPHYPGAWAKIVQKQYREEELKQFLGRLRPVYRSGDAPVWIAVSKVVPDDIVVDEVIALDDLVRPGRATLRLWDACRLAGGVLHPSILPVAAPNLYRSEDDAARDMKAMGFVVDDQGRLDEGHKNHRNTWGFTPVLVTRAADGTDEYAFVRSDERDVADIAARAFGRFLGWEDGEATYEPSVPPKQRAVGAKRAADGIELELGTVEERAEAEANLLQSVAEEVVRNLPPEAFAMFAGQRRETLPIEVKMPVLGRAVGLSMTLDDLASDKSTANLHARLLTGHADIVESPVFDISEVYDHLDGGESDAAGLEA